jgi:adenine-specific DNA-methyltransferase
VTRLDAAVKQRLDRIVAKGLPVLIGDAAGADKAVQRYLDEHGHRHVEVFAAGDPPRNKRRELAPARDIAWPLAKGIRLLRGQGPRHGAEASVGLMLWDGQSRGTLMNVLRLADRGKTVVVYVQPRKAFVDIRTPADLSDLIRTVDDRTASRLRADDEAEGLASSLA